MYRTSPLGSIIQEGQEVEVVLPAIQNPADPYTEPGLSAYSTRPRHLQSEARAGAVQTQILMSEIEALPQIPALDQRDEPHEVSSTEEVINIVDIEIDPIKEKGTTMDYAEDLKQAGHSQTQDISVTPLTEPSQTPHKSEHVIADTVMSEFKPYSFFIEDEIDIMTHKEGKLGALEDTQIVSTALPSVIEHTTKTLDNTPSVITHTTKTPEAAPVASTASSPGSHTYHEQDIKS